MRPDRKDEKLVLSSESKIQLGVLAGNSVLLQLGIGMIIPCLPAYAQSIGLTEASVGIVIAVPSLARACLNLPSGSLTDLIGRKRPMMFGSFLDGVGCIGTALAGGLPMMVGVRLLMGSGSAIAGSAGAAYGMDVLSKFPHHKGQLVGVMQAGGALAWVLGPALGGYLAEAGGICLPFYLVGGFVLAMVPVQHFLLPETRNATARLSELRFRPLVSDATRSFGVLLRQREQQALLLMQFALFTGWSAALAVLPLYAASTWGASPGDLGILYSVSSVLGIVGSPLGGFVADRVGRKPAIAFGAATAAAAYGIVPLLESQSALFASMALLGFGEAFLMSSMAALAIDCTPDEQRGAQSALMSQVGDLTFVVMPIALTAVAMNVSYGAAFACTSVIMAGANVAIIGLAIRSLPDPGTKR